MSAHLVPVIFAFEEWKFIGFNSSPFFWWGNCNSVLKEKSSEIGLSLPSFVYCPRKSSISTQKQTAVRSTGLIHFLEVFCGDQEQMKRSNRLGLEWRYNPILITTWSKEKPTVLRRNLKMCHVVSLRRPFAQWICINAVRVLVYTYGYLWQHFLWQLLERKESRYIEEIEGFFLRRLQLECKAR